MVTGEPVLDVCKRYSIPERTAFDWLEDARRSQWVRSEPGQSREVARADLESLVNDLVAEAVVTLTDQARFARRVDWLFKQDASGIASYRGVEFDRLIRLLAAFRRSEPDVGEDGDIIDGAAT